jgi:hypothetical protein
MFWSEKFCFLLNPNNIKRTFQLSTVPSGAEPGGASTTVTNKSPQRPPDQPQTPSTSNGKPRQEERARGKNGGN